MYNTILNLVLMMCKRHTYKKVLHLMFTAYTYAFHLTCLPIYIYKVTLDSIFTFTVHELQDQFLMLEENLHQLSRITRQERKQLSDELESVSVSGSNAVSFQQKLLLLSNKQKALLNCFEEQKRLGAQLKLMSGQSRYCTRSKGLLGSFGQVKEEVTGHVTKSLLQPTKTRKQSSSFSLLTESATQSTTKHRQQPVGVAKQQQRSVGVSKQQLVSVTKHPVGVAKKQQQPVDVPKQQQPVGVAKQQPQSLGVAKQQQQLVGVVKRQQQQQVGIAKQQQQMSVAVVDMVQQPVGVVQQPVGVAQQSVGVAKQLTDIVPEQVAQKQVQFVGVATQQKSPDITLPLIGASYQQEIVQPVDVYKQQQPGGVAAQPRGVTQQLSAFVIAQQQRVGVTKKQQQPVGVAKQSVGVSQKQPGSVPLASQCAVQPMGETNQPGTTRLLQSELAQPVPLDVLINHSLMIPQDQLNCTLLVPTEQNLFIMDIFVCKWLLYIHTFNHSIFSCVQIKSVLNYPHFSLHLGSCYNLLLYPKSMPINCPVSIQERFHWNTTVY